MKIIHTADWHLGKLVQGVYMTEDQAYILEQFTEAVKVEQPDAVIIAGDLYDRAVPPTEAVHLLDEVLAHIVLDLDIPVLAIAGNHDSPGRLDFGSELLGKNGLHLAGNIDTDMDPVVLEDEAGEVHFHLVPYCDPSMIRTKFAEDGIRTHQDAAEKIINTITGRMDPAARHVLIGHSFVTESGEEAANTSDSERPLAIGGTEQIDSHLFRPFHYTALGHLHKAHNVGDETIRYAGSILKYSVSEEHHDKGFTVVTLDGDGKITTEKHHFRPLRDMYTVEGRLEEILSRPVCEDYVFIRLTDDTPILSPMEKVRSVYPNAMHVERKNYFFAKEGTREDAQRIGRTEMSDIDLFKAFYQEVKGKAPDTETEDIFTSALEAVEKGDHEHANVLDGQSKSASKEMT